MFMMPTCLVALLASAVLLKAICSLASSSACSCAMRLSSSDLAFSNSTLEVRCAACSSRTLSPSTFFSTSLHSRWRCTSACSLASSAARRALSSPRRAASFSSCARSLLVESSSAWVVRSSALFVSRCFLRPPFCFLSSVLPSVRWATSDLRAASSSLYAVSCCSCSVTDARSVLISPSMNSLSCLYRSSSLARSARCFSSVHNSWRCCATSLVDASSLDVSWRTSATRAAPSACSSSHVVLAMASVSFSVTTSDLASAYLASAWATSPSSFTVVWAAASIRNSTSSSAWFTPGQLEAVPSKMDSTPSCSRTPDRPLRSACTNWPLL
mmetsp:Transcript_26900/g.79846  ORF Transcript_26900/g.79846 Transcript_26900/m.79846 type:complete len:327 (-) Transcript_26900:400-1380(-)